MKNLSKKVLVIFFFVPVLSLYSQDSGIPNLDDTDPSHYLEVIIRSSPTMTLELSGHYDFGVYELSANDNGDFSSSEFVDGKNFGVRHGLGGAGLIKISLNDRGYFKLCFSGSYSKFSSKYNKALEEEGEAGFVSYNVFTLGAGVENNFTPGYRFKPLVGIGLIGSVIGGHARVYDQSILSYRGLSIVPAFRLGITVYSGFEYLLNNKFGLNCGIKFVHANLWLKDSKVSENPDEIYLNDKRVSAKTPYTGWRQFAWGSFYGGVNYYFGIDQKNYRVKKAVK